MARLTISGKLISLSVVFAALSAWTAKKTWIAPFGSWNFLLFGFISATCSCMAVASMGILWLRPSSRQGIGSVLMQIFFAIKSHLRGRHILRQVRKSWKNPGVHQGRLLMNILAKNRKTDYGKRFGLKNISSVEEFRKLHPLTTYDHYRPYVERAMAGEEDVMIPGKVKSFLITSGTTGPSKYFPNENHRSDTIDFFDTYGAIADEVCPQLGLLKKQLIVYMDPRYPPTKGGIRIHTAFTLHENGTMKYCYSTPPAGFRISSFNEAIYIHLLFGLREPHIGVLLAGFSGTFHNMMKLLEQWWVDIVSNIEYGTIKKELNLADDIRDSLMRELDGGDRQRARKLRREFQDGFNGILKRVWPHLAVIMAIDNVEIWPTLKQKYAKGIQMVCISYGCTESNLIAVSPWFWEDKPVLAPLTYREAFLEFIKLEDSHEAQPKTYLLEEVEVDHEYEVVITTPNGLYRYRLGDVIRIAGHEDDCPVFQFLYRLGLLLNLVYEKMDQQVVKAALESAVSRWSGITLLEYAAAESTLIPEASSALEKDEKCPYYLIFLEVESFPDVPYPPKISLTDRQMIDVEFRNRNSDYKRLRTEGGISHPRVHFVKPGTFDALKRYILANSTTSANQYKVPRKLKTGVMLEFMLSNVQP